LSSSLICGEVLKQGCKPIEEVRGDKEGDREGGKSTRGKYFLPEQARAWNDRET
jgi:hypothetical protein